MSTPHSTASFGPSAVPEMPGATRSYWKMQCLTGGRVKSTDVAPDNSLVRDTSLQKTTENESIDKDQLDKDIDESLSQQNSEKHEGPASQELSPADDLTLSREQKAVLYMVLESGKNIFFTGAAGTGKSVLLRHIISKLRERHEYNCVVVTALTGIAACNVGGQTLHRFAGVGLARDPVDKLVEKIRRSTAAQERWLQARFLIVDEVSMLSCELLEKLEHIARIIRRSEEPFGGIQLIFTGDLFQLPPVESSNSFTRFCFESPVWKKCIHRTVNLTQVFRQRDPKFASILNEMRLGNVSADADEIFKRLHRPPRLPKGIVPTRLYPTRDEVNRANDQSLRILQETEYSYSCADYKGKSKDASYLDIDKHVIAEPVVKLKVGAQVMLIKNIDNNLVNGSIGRVVAFVTSDQLRYTDYGDRNDKSGTILSHFRSKTLDPESGSTSEQDKERIEKILGAYGDSASARRKRRLAENLTHPEALKKSVLPVVRFALPNGTMRMMIVRPETWEITDFEGEVLASRTQIPLILAWALSIHKAQGQTLPYVCVDLNRIFAKGQAYVAISRSTSLDGLQVISFNRHRVTADDRVVNFYEKLGAINESDLGAAEAHFRLKELKELAARRKQEALQKEMERQAKLENELKCKKTETIKMEDQLACKKTGTIESEDELPCTKTDTIKMEDNTNNVYLPTAKDHDTQAQSLERKRALELAKTKHQSVLVELRLKQEALQKEMQEQEKILKNLSYMEELESKNSAYAFEAESHPPTVPLNQPSASEDSGSERAVSSAASSILASDDDFQMFEKSSDEFSTPEISARIKKRRAARPDFSKTRTIYAKRE